MALTPAERAANYRYAARLEKTTDKLWELVSNPPSKYKGNFRAMPNRANVAETLLDCAAILWDTEWRVRENREGRLGLQILLPELTEEENSDSWTTEQMNDWEAYSAFKEASEAQASTPKKTSKITRNAFCNQILGASLTNTRWGWVGVKESKTKKPGALYLFAWEHNRDHAGPDTVRFFDQDVSRDENGRLRPGHRDALEKIERVQAGDLTPYVVWQTAVDPKVSPKKIESINEQHISRCKLFLHEDGFWCGSVIEDVPLKTTRKLET